MLGRRHWPQENVYYAFMPRRDGSLAAKPVVQCLTHYGDEHNARRIILVVKAISSKLHPLGSKEDILRSS